MHPAQPYEYPYEMLAGMLGQTNQSSLLECSSLTWLLRTLQSAWTVMKENQSLMH